MKNRFFIVTYFVVFTTFTSPVFANWRCEVERCQEYTSCEIDGKSMGCSYKSGSAVSGGIYFENGQILSIEWISKYFDSNAALIKEPTNTYFAWVNNTKRRFKINDTGCVQFNEDNIQPKFSYGTC